MCLDHGVPIDDGDHSQCSIELLECPTHSGEADAPEAQPGEGWQPLQVPANLEEMFDRLVSYVQQRNSQRGRSHPGHKQP